MRQLRISQTITSRESQSLDKYLREISKLEMISPEEETKLFPLIRQGDKKALDKLTNANLRFVVSVAKQFQGKGLSLSDLINEGNIGLIHAAKKFDETKGFKFISYAVWWIRQNILMALANDAQMIRMPLHRKSLGRLIHKTNAVLEQSLERNATTEEIAEALQMDPAEIESQMKLHEQHVSLDSPVHEDEESCLLDTFENPDGVNHYETESFSSSLKTEISRALMQLSERQRETLCYFFGIGTELSLGLEEIAKRFDLTPERVRQIKDKALIQLRLRCNPELLRGFLGA
ncbi:MAG TPA: RNA polymerase sigma factor RpoD/SigA [Chitinophagaceae bacterium]|nr:RNA polymerase sigma factor RpoD/SigA [Chitinophagaceae bacterium]